MIPWRGPSIRDTRTNGAYSGHSCILSVSRLSFPPPIFWPAVDSLMISWCTRSAQLRPRMIRSMQGGHAYVRGRGPPARGARRGRAADAGALITPARASPAAPPRSARAGAPAGAGAGGEARAVAGGRSLPRGRAVLRRRRICLGQASYPPQPPPPTPPPRHIIREEGSERDERER